MTAVTVVKTIGTTGVFSTPQLWEDGAPANLTTAERSAATTFAVAAFQQGENLTFVGSGATGKLVDTDSTGIGTGTYVTYDITAGNPAASDVVTGATSLATCILTSGTADFVGVIWQGQCQNQEFSGVGTQLTVSGSTVSSTAYKDLTTAAGASFRDHVNAQTNALKYNASNGCGIKDTVGNAAVISLSESFTLISNIQISGTTSNGRAITCGNATFTPTIRNVIAEIGTTNVSSTAGFWIASGTAINCCVIQRTTAADHIIATGGSSPFYYNCTFVAPDDLATAPTSVFLSSSAGTVTVQNCSLFAGDSTKAIKAGTSTFNFTTCYSDISGTAGVTQTTYSSEFQNINDATRDFRLKTGAAQIDTGTTDATNAANDIVGTARPSPGGGAYDVGAWELVQAEIPGPPIRITQSNLRW